MWAPGESSVVLGYPRVPVGDMITGGKPARSGRVTSMKIEAHEDVKMVALYEGPRPKGGLKPLDVNRLCHITCIVS